MATYGGKLLAELEEAKASLQKLTHINYDPSQVRDVLSIVGAKVEIFLKAIALPGRNPRNTFEWFIDELVNIPIDVAFREKLHLLRRRYNAAKHDPTVIIPLLEATQIVEDARASIFAIVEKNAGSVGVVINPYMHRVFWVAVWDNYIHGDSDVHIILPGESSHWLGPPTFDIIHIEISAWDSVKASLQLLGIFKTGQGLIPEKQYEVFNDDSNFLGAWVFEGDYRNLITTLAQYELRLDLLPGLNRHENRGSMILAFLLAGIDVVGSVADPTALAPAIIRQATAVYAVPADFQHLGSFADNLATMFQMIEHQEWSRISGPVWMSNPGYTSLAQTTLAKHSKYDIIVDRDYVVRMLWSYH